jgi:hypothetical protein
MPRIPRNVLDQFLRGVRSRSDENWTSMELLLEKRNYGVAIGLLRQEIDTFVRLVYLDAVDDVAAAALITKSVQGKKWPVRDRDMVNTATSSYFWVEIAYRFGCKLVHLSDFHDYQSVDPFSTISETDKQTIIGFLRGHHGYKDEEINLARFVDFMPLIMKKIRGKVADYSSTLQRR